jgi:NAD(P)-dependent dehydrogenase (short-subunit alcohol dehydrogenase family)
MEPACAGERQAGERSMSDIQESFQREVVVVIGAGGLGIAAARRLGMGHHVIVADLAGKPLDGAAEAMRAGGYIHTPMACDSSKREDIAAVIAKVQEIGPLRAVVHTAGLSPQQGSSADILRVNLYGMALVLDEFLTVAREGTVVVTLGSQGGYRQRVSPETERVIALTPTEELLQQPELDPSRFTGNEAYAVSKRGAHVRVQAMSWKYAAKGARTNTVSPGLTMTPQLRLELDGPNGELIRNVVLDRPGARFGTADDIASVIEFLCGPTGTVINGTDILADGGAIAYQRWGTGPTAGTYFSTREPV